MHAEKLQKKKCLRKTLDFFNKAAGCWAPQPQDILQSG